MNIDTPLEAIVYCEGCFGNLNGKTAHGLVRFTKRYNVRAVIDSSLAGRDAGEVLSGRANGIPLCRSLADALEHARPGKPVTHMVIGLAPDGGALGDGARRDVRAALERGLNVDSGLHDYLSDDSILAAVAASRGVALRDVRKCPPKDLLHFFTGKILEVGAPRIAVLGCDSAVGKRTTSWLLIHALEKRGFSAEMIGTGQTAWMQGARYGIMLDTLVNDFLTGEIEHTVWRAWMERKPDALIIEGQGSLLCPAYPGGYEILAGAQPQAVIFQHVPTRKAHDGFPQFPIPPLERQIRAIEAVSDARVVAVAVNHEGIPESDVDRVCSELQEQTRLPVCDPLLHGADRLVEAVVPYLSSAAR